MQKKKKKKNSSFVNLAIFSCLLLNKDFVCNIKGYQLVPELLLKVSDILSMCMKKCQAKIKFLVK